MSSGGKYFTLILALGLVITGSFNTLSNKLADNTCAVGSTPTPYDKDNNPCTDPPNSHQFNHPFVQAAAMFLGEFLCLVAFWILTARGKHTGVPYEEAKTGFKPWALIIPAALDCTGTSLMYVGLTMTYPSVFQMLRGSVVIFTGILSVFFLGRKLYAFHMVGMLLVLVGLLLVGASSVLDTNNDTKSASNPMLGNVFVVSAQVIVAVQMVVEEHILSRHNVPALQVVGLEGVFGSVIISILIVIFYHVHGDIVGNDGKFENVADAMHQLGSSAIVSLAIVGNIISIAFFNFFGISVTKAMSATTRMVLDSVRTFVIWGISLIVGWQGFSGWSGALQILGFVTLLAGTCVYNKLISIPFLTRGYEKDQAALLNPAAESQHYGRLEEDAPDRT